MQKDDGWKQARGKNKKKNKKHWKDKECYGYGKKGHPSSHCPKEKKKDDDDNASTAASIKKLTKELKGMKKQFTTIRTQLKSHEEESDLSDSEDEDDDNMAFQCEVEQFQFAQLEPKFNLRIEALLKQLEKDHPRDLDLRRVWLLDSQSMTNLFCDQCHIRNIKESCGTV